VISNFAQLSASLYMKAEPTTLQANVHAEPDSELVERHQAGDREAFVSLYDRYKVKLYAYCFRLVRNSQDAEDAVHETFLKLFAGIDSLRHAAAFRTWLYRIARNEALMILRRSRGTVHVDPDVLWDSTNPLQILVDKDKVAVIQQALTEMKIEYREVLILREYEGMTYAEIAEVTGASPDSVKSRLFKARRAMHETLQSWFTGGNTL
jgi:RNA polymerase sigma-70 factor (ECF subfamily)